MLDRAESAGRGFVVAGGVALRGAALFEFGNVGAGDERLGLERAAQHDDANLGVLLELSSTTGMPSHISTDSALRRAGLLKVIQPIAPSFSAMIFSVGDLIIASS